MKQVFPGVWKKDRLLLTRNLVPGFRSYTEQLLDVKGKEYRVWDPNRSKMAAAIAKGLKTFPVKPGIKMLYLGAAQGYTPSFFSDIVGKDGIIYALEISERSLRDLSPVAEKRGNIVPVLADARKPQDYDWIEPADIVYQDVATPDQSEILVRNCKSRLKPGCFAVIAIKARSIDVTQEPRKIYVQQKKILSSYFKIVEQVELDPFEKDHCLFVVQRP
jgi:fibrillarin-like pre-rRNA processing protein